LKKISDIYQKSDFPKCDRLLSTRRCQDAPGTAFPRSLCLTAAAAAGGDRRKMGGVTRLLRMSQVLDRSEKLTAALALRDRSITAGAESWGYAAAGEEILDLVRISHGCDTTCARITLRKTSVEA